MKSILLLQRSAVVSPREGIVHGVLSSMFGDVFVRLVAKFVFFLTSAVFFGGCLRLVLFVSLMASLRKVMK